MGKDYELSVHRKGIQMVLKQKDAQFHSLGKWKFKPPRDPILANRLIRIKIFDKSVGDIGGESGNRASFSSIQLVGV